MIWLEKCLEDGIESAERSASERLDGDVGIVGGAADGFSGAGAAGEGFQRQRNGESAGEMEGAGESVGARSGSDSGGKKIIGMHCAECHGQNAEGTHRAPTMRSSDVQEATPGAIFWVLTNGIVWHGMPVWSKLPEPMRWQLVAYVKSLGLKSKDVH